MGYWTGAYWQEPYWYGAYWYPIPVVIAGTGLGEGGGKRVRYPRVGRRGVVGIDQYFLDKIQALSLELPKKKQKKKRKIFIPEKVPFREERYAKVPAKLIELPSFASEVIREPALGFDLATLFEEDGARMAFDYLDTYRQRILARNTLLEALRAENATRSLLMRRAKEIEDEKAHWGKLKQQIEHVLLVKAMRVKEEGELLTILSEDDEEMLLLIN